MRPLTFTHAFQTGGLCATLTFFPDGVLAGEADGLVCNWNREPAQDQVAQLLPEYLAWRAECFQTIANETGMRVLGFVQTEPQRGWAADFTPEAKT